ncbi:VOC family protein [Streptomyces sp. NPDC050738]|uniref:VOC family protein n=1 Tax=Streptomyces sp. NPDC050738 TaxID=3154744 RepID=UPI00342C30D0
MIHNKPSTPTWADLSTTDIAAAKTFYTGLFGWSAGDVPMEDASGYGMWMKGEDYVGGYGPCMAPGQPPAWMAYFGTADIEATTAAVTANGGTVVAGPMDVFTSGKLAACTDPEGAFFGLWQPLEHQGFGRVEEPGAFAWFELLVRDTEKAKAFYTAVFGWDGDTHPYGPTSYTEWSIDGEKFSGMMPIDENFPAEVPAHWMVYMAVADCDAAAAKVGELGGKVLVQPTTIPPGRFSVISDPQGALLAVIALSPDRR